MISASSRYDSTEVRWFITGAAPPASLLRYFSQRGAAASRTDYYLSETGNALGIKWRENLLEVKQRTGLGTWLKRANPLIEARAEHWTKWSFALVQGEKTLHWLSEQGGAWIPVTKTRYLLTYEWLEGRIRELETIETVPYGCAVELSELKIKGKSSWSICLESFGKEQAIRVQALEAVFAVFFSPDLSITLSKEKAMSYPLWLARMMSS